jgi:hypothetical protein
MGLFSLNNILLENDNSTSFSVIDIDNIGYVDNDVQRHSFVQEGYDAILEMNAFYCNAEKEFYTKVMGSYGDSNIINESFSDFFNKIKDIIKKFIEWIKKVFKEFVAKLAALVGSEKYIKKNAKLLNKFGSEDEFEFQGYIYTNIDNVSMPVAAALDMFNGTVGQENFFKDIIDNHLKSDSADDYYGTKAEKWNAADGFDDVERKRRADVTDKLNQALGKSIDTLNDSLDDYYEAFRGRVLGETKKYDSKEFTDRLFEIFRDDSDSTSSITIDSNFVMDAHRRFDKYKDTIKNIEKTQKDIIKDYEDLEKQLDKLIKYNKTNMTVDFNDNFSRNYTSTQIGKLNNLDDNVIYSSSTVDKMQSWLKIQSSKVNQMCQIHTQAFSAKLEAAKDCFKQDKQILNKAIQKILKRSDKEGF